MSIDYITKTLNIYKQVKTFDYEPVYYIGKEYYGGSYEFFINDMPVESHFESFTRLGLTNATKNILSSGKQKLKIKLYPPVVKDANNKKYTEQFIKEDAYVKLEVFHSDYRYNGDTSVCKYEMPKPGISIPYLEYEVPFEAKIPYQLTGWSKSVNLKKEDSAKLEQEVKAFYQNFAEQFEAQNINTIAGLLYNRQIELAQADFEYKEEYSKDIIETLKADMERVKEFLPFEDRKLTFYGDGKVVGLVIQSGTWKGSNGILFRTNDKKQVNYGLLLHRPKAGGPLEIIR